MPSAVNRSAPTRPARIALINPTKFLGNLLLAGGLIQQFNAQCQRQGIELLVVLDEAFRELFADALPGAQLVYYPRRALSRGVSLTSVRLWLDCVREIRRFAADLAFTIEEDSVCHRLAHLSGARQKVSSTVHRYHWGFDQVLDIPRSARAAGEESIWYSFRDVFRELELPLTDTDGAVPAPAYVSLAPPAPDPRLLQRLAEAGLDLAKPVAVLHAGASKHYKQWPVSQFVVLARLLAMRGYQQVLIGAGQRDAAVNRAISEALAGTGKAGETGEPCIDLCNQLSLVELASVLTGVDLMIGNDSGPSHLASALGVKGVVIFGPTELAIWRPLGEQTTALQHRQACAPDCTRHQCLRQYACLLSISPARVMQALGLASGQETRLEMGPDTVIDD